MRAPGANEHAGRPWPHPRRPPRINDFYGPEINLRRLGVVNEEGIGVDGQVGAVELESHGGIGSSAGSHFPQALPAPRGRELGGFLSWPHSPVSMPD